MPTELHDWLETPPKRKEAVVKQIASELLVPDFFLFAQKPLLPPASIADFRLSRPVPRPYQRDTLKAIDLAKSIQLDAGKRTTFKSQNRLCKHVPSSLGPQKAASTARKPPVRAWQSFPRRRLALVNFRLFGLLDHTARHKASDLDGITFNHRHRPDHRSTCAIRHRD
jgi:hypothetical protein